MSAARFSHSFIWLEQSRISHEFGATFAERAAAYCLTVVRCLEKLDAVAARHNPSPNEKVNQICDQFERENPGFFSTGGMARHVTH